MGRPPKATAPVAPEPPPRRLKLPPEMTKRQVADELDISTRTVERAIAAGELKGFIPRGRDARHTGQMGYRFSAAEVERWYFNKPIEPEAGS